MSIRNKSGFVSAIMFDIKDEVYSDLLVTRRRLGYRLVTDVLESIVVINLSELRAYRVIPLGVLVLSSSSLSACG